MMVRVDTATHFMVARRFSDDPRTADGGRRRVTEDARRGVVPVADDGPRVIKGVAHMGHAGERVGGVPDCDVGVLEVVPAPKGLDLAEND